MTRINEIESIEELKGEKYFGITSFVILSISIMMYIFYLKFVIDTILGYKPCVIQSLWFHTLLDSITYIFPIVFLI